MVAGITEVDAELIRRFAVIINALTCGLNVNPDKFEQYGRSTEQHYLSLYSWHNIPPTVHKVLRHGGQIVRHLSELPISFFSEEAQESRNKDYKRFRLYHSRKTARAETTRDVLNNLLVSSDPVISALRRDKEHDKQLIEGVHELLELENKLYS